MITYNELSREAAYAVVGDDNFYLFENLDPEEKVDVDKKVGYEVKIENG